MQSPMDDSRPGGDQTGSARCWNGFQRCHRAAPMNAFPGYGEFIDAPHSQFSSEEVPGLGIRNAGDIIVPPPRSWLLGNVFCRRFVSSLIGEGGTGKTALRYAQLMSLATKRPLTGEHVFQRSRVLILSLEDDADELDRRL